MGRVLICEPDAEVRELLGLVVARLGHEPVFEPNGFQDLSAILLEPADVISVEVTQAARAADPLVPIVCASIEPPTSGSRLLAPVAHLLKPFSLPQLEDALQTALAPDA